MKKVIEQFWILIAEDLDTTYNQGHPSNWENDQIKAFLLSMENELSYFYNHNLKEATRLRSSLVPISSQTFRRIFIEKTSKGKVVTKNQFANYLGFISYEEYISKNKERFQIEIIPRSIESEVHSNPKNVKEVLPFYIIEYINEKSYEFAGRHWITKKIDQFIKTVESENNSLGIKHTKRGGYFWIKGDPGIGKSAFAANLSKELNCMCHFNIQSQGVSSPNHFLDNIGKQLKYHVGKQSISFPNDVTKKAQLIQELLKEKSLTKPSEKCIIIIDALDEVDMTSFPLRTNHLFLPREVPENIYFIVTSRRNQEIQLTVNCNVMEMEIEHDSFENLQDINSFIQNKSSQQPVQKYLKQHNLNNTTFANKMVEKSEGNFMYLTYIFKDIISGRYQETYINHLPQGLRGYYEEHWKIIRNRDDFQTWSKIKIPILATLSLSNKPLSLKALQMYSNVEKMSYVSMALKNWEQFIHAKDNYYSIYHSSFNDFLKQKSEIASEVIDLTDHRNAILNKMKKLFKE